MKDTHVRMVIEFDIDHESLEEKGLKPEDVLKNLTFKDHDVIDGFEISTNIPGFDCASDFYLCNGSVVSKEFIPARSRGDNLDKWREMVREELDLNGEVYGISAAETEKLLESDSVIDSLALHIEVYMFNFKVDEYRALDMVFNRELPEILEQFREKPSYIPCSFVSVWADYGEVSSPAKYDPVNNVVYDIESVDLSEEELAECEILEGEYMDLLGERFELAESPNNFEYTVVEEKPLDKLSGVKNPKPNSSLADKIKSAENKNTGFSQGSEKEPER